MLPAERRSGRERERGEREEREEREVRTMKGTTTGEMGLDGKLAAIR